MKFNIIIALLLLLSKAGFSSDYQRLSDIKIVSSIDDHISNPDHYLKPNEFLNNAYGDFLVAKSGGAVMSLGTIRSFIIFGLAKPDYGVFLDYDPLVVEYNKSLLNLMVAISKLGMSIRDQRYLFLALLSFEWLSKEDFSNLENADEMGVISYVAKKPKFILSEKLLEMPADIRSAMASFLSIAESCLQCGKYATEVNDKFYDFFDDFNMALEDYFNHRLSERDYRFFFEDDTQWEFILDAIKEHKIAVIQSDISSADTLKEISSALKTLGSQVRLIDISNIVESHLHYLSNTARANLINIVTEMLPLSPDARILFTHQKEPKDMPARCTLHGKQKSGTDGLEPWHYYSLPAKDASVLGELP